MSEPAVIQTLAVWLETAGPKRCITWIAETCDEIAIRDIPTWRFWIKMGSLFRDIAAALPAYNEMPTDDVPRPRPNDCASCRHRQLKSRGGPPGILDL